MVIFSASVLFLVGFVGYVIGRWGDYYLNFWVGDRAWFNCLPDHWIYGLILMILGLTLLKKDGGLYFFSFGTGLFISDLKDFLNLKFYGPDNKDKSQRKFWHID